MSEGQLGLGKLGQRHVRVDGCEFMLCTLQLNIGCSLGLWESRVIAILATSKAEEEPSNGKSGRIGLSLQFSRLWW